MTTVNDVLCFLDSLAPRESKMEWDNVGLLCGSGSQPVNKILVALDPFESICREAVEVGADLIVTHHPLIFKPVSAITDDTAVGKAILFLISNGISAINAHTNLDCAPGGVNDCLATTLGLSDVQMIPADPNGLLRQGSVESQSIETFMTHIKEVLGCPGLRYVSANKPVHRVGVGGGSCGDMLPEVAQSGCDTFITADVKYNQFWDAKEYGINLIDAGHFYTENPVCQYLAEQLSAHFTDIDVKASQKHTDCAKFFY